MISSITECTVQILLQPVKIIYVFFLSWCDADLRPYSRRHKTYAVFNRKLLHLKWKAGDYCFREGKKTEEFKWDKFLVTGTNLGGTGDQPALNACVP